MVTFYTGRVPSSVDPPGNLDSSLGLAPLGSAEEDDAKAIAALMRKGGNVAVGSHGNMAGIGFHWELWAYARGGMPNHDILRAATMNGAYSLGMEKDLGSIEAGKIADLLIFDKNPLSDIRNSLSLSQVMQRGVLRESATLDEVWPERRALPAWKLNAREAVH